MASGKMSAIDICNMALSYVGHTEIIGSFADASVGSILCGRFYNISRQSLLSSFPWNFATKTIDLTEVTDETDDTFSYVYEYPSDCLRVIRIGMESDGGEPTANTFNVRLNDEATPILRIATDIEDARCNYIVDMQDTAYFPAYFCDALALYLATRLSTPLSSSGQLTAAVSQQAAQAVDYAKRMCALERRIPPQAVGRYNTARS